jgi:hypothetical protein
VLSWSHFHHGTTRPHFADGREGLQIRGIAANILNKQSRTAEKGWASSLELGGGLTTPHLKKKQRVTKCYTVHRTRVNSLERLKQRNMDMSFGT